MSDRFRPEPWAVDVDVKAESLRSGVRLAMADPRQSNDQHRKIVADSVEQLLYNVEQAARRRWRGPVDRWRGISIAHAYKCLHAAETSFVDLMSAVQVRAVIPDVVARAQAVFDPADPRRVAIEQLRGQADVTPAYRDAVQQAMRLTFQATDQVHVRIRNFRNLLISSATVIVVLMAALVWLIAQRPDVMPMCFQPEGRTVCPSGADHPTGIDLPIVAGLGVLGGALAAAFSIRNVRGTSTPYDVPIAVALLKPALGALTAVSSILLLGGDFVPGLSQLDSQRQILAYALVFGYGQQLVSRLIDNQAHTILDSLPSKDPQRRQSTASVSTARPPTDAPTDADSTSEVASSTTGRWRGVSQAIRRQGRSR